MLFLVWYSTDTDCSFSSVLIHSLPFVARSTFFCTAIQHTPLLGAGFGGYGRLGHKEQKDEFQPRPLETFMSRVKLPKDAVVRGWNTLDALYLHP